MNSILIKLKKEQYNSELNKYLFNYGDEIKAVDNSKAEWSMIFIEGFRDIVNKLNFNQIDGIKINYNIE